MKTRTLTILSLTILASLLLGAVAFTVLSAPQELKLKVKWRPVNYVFGNAPPDPWIAEVYFAPLRPVDEIDPSTIRLEGTYTPSGPTYEVGTPPRLAIPFNGNEVLRALLIKAPHMAPGEYRILLEITGALDDGTPFRGSGGINLIVPENSPP